ncbi:4 [Hexamita inflata]|uniref:4 n=1 Tax=Hexamita inflata TaxID=28002 RepID=A0ABP1H7A1_9EUKA
MLQQIVSQKRRRFIDDKFNIDLTYITDRIIAMSYPASGFESLYRNNIQQSQPIDDKNHQKTLQRDRDDDKLQRHICVDAIALEWIIQITVRYMQIYRINDQMSKFTCICILLYNSLIIYYFQI